MTKRNTKQLLCTCGKEDGDGIPQTKMRSEFTITSDGILVGTKLHCFGMEIWRLNHKSFLQLSKCTIAINVKVDFGVPFLGRHRTE
jgi:hypothetical protein